MCVYIFADGHRFVITVCGPLGDVLSAKESREERECAACQRSLPCIMYVVTCTKHGK